MEVLSPDDVPADVGRKVDEYLTLGTALVLVIDPHARSVTLHRRLAPPIAYTNPDDTLDLADVVLGFRCSVGNVFE